MWPARPPARASTSSAAASMRSHGPSSSGGIEVSLDAVLLADDVPAAVQRDAPVEADHVTARARERAQQVFRHARAEVDRRHVDRVEDARGVRRDELVVVGGVSAPTHESKSWITSAPAAACAAT